jgi:2',3'-cyclic-nucleotide 2'-phosphodiesterase (5'-nucleotidase family)
MFLLLSCLHPASPPPSQEAVAGELALEGTLKARMSEEPADLVIFYGGERKGSMETCGCPNRPRGSFARAKSYIDAVAKSNVPMVQVDAGYWLEDPTSFEGGYRPDLVLLNRWVLKGMQALHVDALNVGSIELAALKAMESEPELAKLPMVSAQVQSGPLIKPYVIVERAGHRIGITGISGTTPTLGDPIAALGGFAEAKKTIEELAEKADIVVLLSWQATESAKHLAESIRTIDLVVDASQYRDYAAPVVVGHAVWVFSHYQTMRLGELRLSLDETGAITRALDRKIDLDPQLPDDPELLRLQHNARYEVAQLQEQLP